MIRNSIKNGCKNLYLHPKSFKLTLKPNSCLMSTWRPGQVNASTHTFCNIDVAQAMAYWCSQKLVAFDENTIRNLERIFKLTWDTISSLWGWFIWFFSSCSLAYNEGRTKLSEFFVSICTSSGFWILKNMFTLQYLL